MDDLILKHLKIQERKLQYAADQIKENFLKPVYHQVEGINILLSYSWDHPIAEILWLGTINILNDVRKQIIDEEKREKYE